MKANWSGIRKEDVESFAKENNMSFDDAFIYMALNGIELKTVVESEEKDTSEEAISDLESKSGMTLSEIITYEPTTRH